jgi:hypothetical protein
MSGRRWIIVASVMLAGCNLLSGAADLSAAGGDSPIDPEVTDGAAPAEDARDEAVTALMEGGSSDATRFFGDGASDASLDAEDATFADAGQAAFVSSTTTTGAMNGLFGADKMCSDLATSAGLGGTWVAWLGTNASPPGTRLTFAGPWHLVSGQQIAKTRALLITSPFTLEHPIDRDERGIPVSNATAWTGPFGLLALGDCSMWNVASAGPTSYIGSTAAIDQSWTESTTAACSTAHHLYCFQN